jgi:hypothetical protein
MPHIFFWLLFISIMSAFRKDSEFSIHKMAIELNALFHIKKVASVRK